MADDSTLSRRRFIGATAGIAGGALIPTTACSYARIRGANDRIQIGMLGCGARAEGLLRMVGMSQKDGNLQLRSVCDLWSVNRDKMQALGKAQLGDEFVDVISDGPFISVGRTIEVVEVSGNRVIVREVG